MDNFGYREMGWPAPLQTPTPSTNRSRITRSISTRSREPEEYPLKGSFKHVRNIDLLEAASEPGKAKEYLFVGPSPPAEDGSNMYHSFDIMAPDPEARLTEDMIRKSLCEKALTLGAGRFFDDVECGLITADNIEEHICSAPEVVVNLTLLWAALLTRDELLPAIIDSGADIHYSEPVGLTALHIAAFSGASRSVAYLLSIGADIDYAPKYFAPLHCAAFGNSLEVAEVLIAHGASLHGVVQRAGCEDNLVHCAVRNDALECMELFIEKGVDPGYSTSGGLNALHLAAELGAQRCLAFLLKETKLSVKGLTKQRDKECTALHLAASRGYAECVELLLSEGAQANIRNYRGFTALHLAARCSSLECVEVLLRDGNADANAEDHDKRTPLHAAICNTERACEIIDMLVSWGAQVNKKDEYGYSPLHLAAMDGLAQCVETLIFLGADVTSKSKKGHTALSVIVRKTPKSMTILRHNLDNGISLSRSTEGNEEVQIEFDFGKLLKYSYPREITYLNSLIDEGQKDILQHPLCSAFLFMKWRKIRKFYLARLIFCFLFVSFLSIYVLTAVVKTCKGKNSMKYGVPNELCQHQSLLGDILEENPIEFERWVLIAITAFEIVRKLTGITGYSSLYQYFTSFENLMEWFVLLSVFSLYNIQKEYGWQNHVGGYAVLGAWTNLMLMMGQLPMFGDYVAMYQKVLTEFLKLLLAYICLLLGFTICFCVVFPNEEMFSNPLMGFISTLSMMVGELNLNILINDPMLEDPPLISELSCQIIFILFLMFVTIILMNLLVGIAVHDIQGLRKTAGLSKLVRQTKLILFVEMGMFSAWLPKCLHKYVYRTALVSPEAGKVILSVKPLNPNEKRLPTDIMMAAYEMAQINKLKSGRSVKEMLYKNRYASKFKNEGQSNDQNFNIEIRGMQEKIDQTTFNLKKIDQEMKHLNILLMEQSNLLQNLLKAMDKSYTQYSIESPVFFPSNVSDVTSVTK
ncbi:transient receptor potential channel pyrexia-like isoform X1 [Vanessa atalanta]|uniref:transient receptor potential channel pyrexia-like isoform X1 n=1 Tax=Vanessa atalanta TaxID=42275 RepID=UPI001FCD389A|nr:transient receptor potential channel pyrexia-like isoform X1 [Vanessa atalanta]